MTAKPITAVDDAPAVVEFSAEELKTGIPSPQTLFNAVTWFMRDGLLVLKDVIPVDKLDKLNAVMSKEALELVKRSTTHQNFSEVRQISLIRPYRFESSSTTCKQESGNISQVPPLMPEYLFPEIYANPLAGHILAAILGPEPELRYLHGNTALKGKQRQPVHADLGFEHLDHPFAIAANVLLVDANEANGSTEVWLGRCVYFS
jgi:hypothetical protein